MVLRIIFFTLHNKNDILNICSDLIALFSEFQVSKYKYTNYFSKNERYDAGDVGVGGCACLQIFSGDSH